MGTPYRTETPPGWSATVEKTWTVEEQPDGVRLFGECPTCHHPTEALVLEVTFAPGSRLEAGRKGTGITGPERVTIICDCGREHAGRPDNGRGCGRAGYLLLEQDPT